MMMHNCWANKQVLTKKTTTCALHYVYWYIFSNISTTILSNPWTGRPFCKHTRVGFANPSKWGMFFVVYRWVSRIDSFFGYTFVLTLCLIRFLGLPLGGLPICIFWGSYRNPWETLFLYFGRSGQRRPLAGQEHLNRKSILVLCLLNFFPNVDQCSVCPFVWWSTL